MTDAAKAVTRRDSTRWMRKREWHRAEHDSHLRGRIYRIILRGGPWWSWGNRVMILVGRAWCGNYDVPKPPDLWWRWEGDQIEIARSYDEWKAATESGRHDWKSIRVENDGFELNISYYPDGGFYGLSRREIPLVARYVLRWRVVSEWCGLRRWIYYRALHNAVEQKKPFSCQATPPRNSGGYSHWHCQEKRRHDGPHRFNNYTWGDEAVTYAPADGSPS